MGARWLDNLSHCRLNFKYDLSGKKKATLRFVGVCYYQVGKLILPLTSIPFSKQVWGSKGLY